MPEALTGNFRSMPHVHTAMDRLIGNFRKAQRLAFFGNQIPVHQTSYAWLTPVFWRTCRIKSLFRQPSVSIFTFLNVVASRCGIYPIWTSYPLVCMIIQSQANICWVQKDTFIWECLSDSRNQHRKYGQTLLLMIWQSALRLKVQSCLLWFYVRMPTTSRWSLHILVVDEF